MSSNFSAVISKFAPEDAPKPSAVCSVSGKAFERGDVVYSFLCEESDGIKRYDLSAEAKRYFTPPGTLLAQWKSKVGVDSERTRRAKLAPNDALTSLFVSLENKPERAALRYALALLLTRRRVFRFEMEEDVKAANSDTNAKKDDVLYVYSPRDETGYVVPVVEMNARQAAEVQAELLELLDAPVATNRAEETSQEKAQEKTTNETNKASEPQIAPNAFDSSEVADAAEAALKALEEEFDA